MQKTILVISKNTSPKKINFWDSYFLAHSFFYLISVTLPCLETFLPV
jgi:hypothetical protein